MKKLALIMALCLIIPSSQVKASWGVGIISAGLGYLFGKSANRPINSNTTIQNHITNKTNINIDLNGIERELQALTEATRLAGPNYHLESADKADYIKHYNLDTIGPIIGIDIHSADATIFVQNYGKAELQKVIEDRIKDKAISMLVTHSILENLKSSCSTDSLNGLAMFNIPELMYAIEAKTGINTYSSLDPNKKYNLLSKKAKEDKNISSEDIEAYLDVFISAAKSWYEEQGKNVSYSDLKNFVENNIGNDALANLSNVIKHQKDQYIDPKQDFLKLKYARCEKLRKEHDLANKDLSKLNSDRLRVTSGARKNRELLESEISASNKAFLEMYEEVKQKHQELRNRKFEYVKNVRKVKFDVLGAQEYIITTSKGNEFRIWMKSEMSGDEVKEILNIIANDHVANALGYKMNRFLPSELDVDINKDYASKQVGSFINDIEFAALHAEKYNENLFKDKLYEARPIGEINSNFFVYQISRNVIMEAVGDVEGHFEHMLQLEEASREKRRLVSSLAILNNNEKKDLAEIDKRKNLTLHIIHAADATAKKCEDGLDKLKTRSDLARKTNEQIELSGAPMCSEKALANIDNTLKSSTMVIDLSVNEDENEVRTLASSEQFVDESGSQRE